MPRPRRVCVSVDAEEAAAIIAALSLYIDTYRGHEDGVSRPLAAAQMVRQMVRVRTAPLRVGL